MSSARRSSRDRVLALVSSSSPLLVWQVRYRQQLLGFGRPLCQKLSVLWKGLGQVVSEDGIIVERPSVSMSIPHHQMPHRG